MLNDFARVSTGFRSLDAILPDSHFLSFGLPAGAVAVVAGRPGVGKTAFMLNMANNMSAAGETVDFFSVSDTASMLNAKLHCIKTEGDIAKCLTDGVGVRVPADENIRFFYDPELNAASIYSLARPERSVVFVDYTPLFGGESLRREAEGLHAIAEATGSTIIVGDMLNSSFEPSVGLLPFSCTELYLSRPDNSQNRIVVSVPLHEDDGLWKKSTTLSFDARTLKITEVPNAE